LDILFMAATPLGIFCVGISDRCRFAFVVNEYRRLTDAENAGQ